MMRPEIAALFEQNLQRKSATWRKMAEGLAVVKVLKESEISDLPNALSEGRWYLFCPGCYLACKQKLPQERERVWLLASIHCFSEKVHQFNGDVENPTLSPSLLCSHTEMGEGGQERQKCCHSFVRDGTIQFLGDCTHPMANQTVELMDAQLYLDARQTSPI